MKIIKNKTKKCFKPMKSIELTEEEFETYHLKIIEEKVIDKQKFDLTVWECECLDKRKIILIN